MGSRPSSRFELARGWALWPQVLVRGAGFPFAWLDEVVTSADVSRALRDVARDEKFREAVTWQNRAAVADGLDSLLRKPDGATDAKTRKKELLVVRYLQRYCAKNDTIGFFGPVGWAQNPSPPGRGAREARGEGRFVAGPSLLAARATFFEPWVARVLADSLAADPQWRGEALVWLPGDLRVSGRKLITPTATYALTASDAALLTKLETPRRAKTLPRAQLESLAERGIIRWTFSVSISHEPLKRLPVSLAVPKLSELADLEARFTELTRHAPKRHEGRTYGGRGLVYEECRRDLSLTLSEAMWARVSRPLSVVLDVARWYSAQLGAQLTRRMNARFKKRVPLHVFWAQTAPLFAGAEPPVVTPTAKLLRKKWNALWQGRSEVSTEDAEAFVAKHFKADGPGWPGARHHAPDLLWEAESAEAMLRGEGTPILGELHPGVTPFTTLSVLANAPDRAALERQWHDDFGDDGITPIPWEDFARSSQDARLSKRHWHLDVGYEFESDRPAKRVLRAADFDVVRRSGRLVAVHTKRKLEFDLLRVFERRIKLIAALHFSLGDGLDSGPRRTLGGLVVQRAHWKLPRELTGELDDASKRASFRARHGLPRRVFVRSPEEVKPVYVDFDAPILVEMLARLARQALWLSFSEMLPTPDGLWLRDAHGARYVAELRCIAVDPVPFTEKRR